MAWTANLGGQVRHTELSSGVAAESQSDTDKSGRSEKNARNISTAKNP
jgi:hypothetical protein